MDAAIIWHCHIYHISGQVIYYIYHYILMYRPPSHSPNQISLWGPHDPMNGTPRSHLIEYHSVWNWITMDHSTKITAIYCQHNLQCTTYSSHCSSTRFNWWFLTLHNQLSLLVYQWLSKDVFRALIRWAFQQQASQTSLTLELLMNRTVRLSCTRPDWRLDLLRL